MFFIYSYRQDNKTPIAEETFEALANSKNVIMEAVAVEEKFDVLLENHVELEETLHKLALRHMMFGNATHAEFNRNRNLIDRRLINVLSSARLYRDALSKHAIALLEKGSESDAIIEAVANNANKSDAFRIVEALRNYSQHQELPLSALSVGSKWENHGTPDALSATNVVPKINAIDLAQQRGLPEDLRATLQRLGKKAEVMPMLRRYLEQMGVAQVMFRSKTSEIVNRCKTLIEKTILEYEVEKPVLIRASREEEAVITQEVTLFPEFVQHLVGLQRKNGSLVNLSKRYVNLSTQTGGN